MSNTRVLSPEVLASSKAAANYKYDTSQYMIVNSQIRREARTGRLVSKEQKK